MLSTISRRPISESDWGIFVIQIITPVLITFCSNRIDLLKAICRVSVVFAVADFSANALTYLGIFKLAEHVGDGSEYGLHYLGLPGNSFAEGLISFLAISYTASGIARSPSALSRLARYGLLVALFVSEWLIRARVDLGLSIVAVFLLIWPWSFRLPMAWVAIALSAVFLASTFYPNPYKTDETLRRDLMTMGVRTALERPLLGDGPRYRATADLDADYRQLHQAGITESGTLDFAIAYGIPSTVCLYLSTIFALAATRFRQTLPAVLLVCLTGSLAMTGGLGSFLGSIVFYLALIICQREEWWLLRADSRLV